MNSEPDDDASTGDVPVTLGVTMGDPGGIGPEVILKGLDKAMSVEGPVVIFGAKAVLGAEERRLVDAGLLDGPIIGGEQHRQGAVEVAEVAPEFDWPSRPVGPTGPPGAVVQKRALDEAMNAVDAGEIDAIVTAPWNKSLFAEIDEPVVGHTEKLAAYFGVDDEVVMMLAGPRLRVALVTTHISIDEVPEAVTGAEIERTAGVTARALRRRFGISRPHIAVCGLNPHAGESGHMGREELDVIEPAVDDLSTRWEAEDVEFGGPMPADTLFAKFRNDAPYDAVVCMYHDQGLIPLKLLHFGQSANITLGLPVIRTSVDHGTAYDIAGESVADPGSMIYAMETAARMVRAERKRR